MLPKGLYARALLIILSAHCACCKVGAGVCVSGTALEPGDAAAVGGDGARYCRHRRTLRNDGHFLNDPKQAGRFGAKQTGTDIAAVLAAGRICHRKNHGRFWDCSIRALSEEIRNQVKRDAWIDTVGQSNQVEIRVKLDNATLKFRGAARADLCLQQPYLSCVDGRHIAGAGVGGRGVVAQPDPADFAARRSG